MYTDLATLCVTREISIREAVERMDRNRMGMMLVVDGGGRLAGIITDGDVRRAILANLNFGQGVGTLLDQKAGTSFAKPITAAIDAPRESLLQLLQAHSILYLPLLDAEERVAGLVTLDEFLPHQTLALQAVVMAGGKGTRLYPLTKDTPKPMLPVGERPLMERTIARLREMGIRQVKVTTHHQPEKIVEHFGNGSEFGVELSYVPEHMPLGTAGGLGLLERPTETTLVINGDILTEVDFRAMLAFHREHEADLTVAVRQYDVKVPYGVVQCSGATVTGISEKPVYGVFVNAGIYLLEPSVYALIPSNQRYDMTDLIQGLLTAGRPVVSFPVREYWLDIGAHEEYARADQDIRDGKVQGMNTKGSAAR